MSWQGPAFHDAETLDTSLKELEKEISTFEDQTSKAIDVFENHSNMHIQSNLLPDVIAHMNELQAFIDQKDADKTMDTILKIETALHLLKGPDIETDTAGQEADEDVIGVVKAWRKPLVDAVMSEALTLDNSASTLQIDAELPGQVENESQSIDEHNDHESITRFVGSRWMNWLVVVVCVCLSDRVEICRVSMKARLFVIKHFLHTYQKDTLSLKTPSKAIHVLRTMAVVIPQKAAWLQVSNAVCGERFELVLLINTFCV